MRRLVRAFGALAFAGLCALTLSGCWDKEELAELIFIAGIGLDAPESGEGVLISAEFIKISSGKDDTLHSAVFDTQGRDITDALVQLACHAGGKLNFNYCEVIVMGEAYARRGMADAVDMVLRNNDIQHTVLLAVAAGCTAAEIFAAKADSEPVAAYEISGIIKANYNRCLQLAKNDAYRIRPRLEGPDCAASVLTRLALVHEEDGDKLTAGGAAVFRKDRLAGWLSPAETAYFRIASGDAQDGLESAPGEDGGLVSAELSGFGLKPEVYLDGDAARAALSVRADAKLIEPKPSGDVSEPWDQAEFSRTFERSLESGISELFHRGRDELGCDLLDIRGMFARKYGRHWAELGLRWEELFAGLELSVSANVGVEDAGMIRG